MRQHSSSKHSNSISPSHPKFISQKPSNINISLNQLENDKTDKENERKFDDRYHKPMKLMHAFTDGHLGTYAPCIKKTYRLLLEINVFLSDLLFRRI